MGREELDAMWERIKALEENQLKVSKAIASESVVSIYNLELVGMGLVDKMQAYQKYMKPKMNQARQGIFNAESIDKVIELLRNFNSDCIEFVKSVAEHG
jgi:hypothetical protein